jgi:hypothetical protein
MDAATNRDAGRGVRQFVVGAGGKSHSGSSVRHSNSEVRDDLTFGVLKLTLGSNGYRWEYVTDAPGVFDDAGANACH